MSAQPTLLVFTLGPDREQARRRLLPEPLNAVEREFHQSCLESTLEAGRACGWQIAVASPERITSAADVVHVEQRGEGFGARFRRAFHSALEATGGPVVAVGSDSPGLRPSHLTAAVAALEGHSDRVVVGPAADGGFYLLAASRPLDVELSAVRWRSRDTLETLLERLRCSGREVVLLSALEDLDRPNDLTRWVARARTDEIDALPTLGLRRVVGLLRRALAGLRQFAVARDAARLDPALVASRYGRAPPS